MNRSSAARAAVLAVLAAAAGGGGEAAAQPVYGSGAPQDSTTLVGRGMMAYAAGRHAAARDLFREATRADSRDVQARFLLARVLADTVLAARGDARGVLEDARRLAPDDLDILLGLITLLRDDAPTFLQDRLREEQRIEIAGRVLRLDPENALAHEELGRAAVRDVWRYKGALAITNLPTVAIATRSALRAPGVSTAVLEEGDDGASEDSEFNPTGSNSLMASADAARVASDAVPDNAVLRSDRYDLARMRRQGVPMVDLSSRSTDALARAEGHFRRAIASDPFRREAYDDLMRAYALTDQWSKGADVAAGMYRVYPDDVRMWRYLGLVRLRVGDAEGAERAFGTADRFATPAERAAFADLTLLIRDDERAAYAADPAGFAQRFWTSQDPRLLTTYNERRLEHAARMTYADLVLSAPGVGKRGWETERGRILVRYGPPKEDRMLYTNPRGGAASVAADFALVNLWQYADGLRLVFDDAFRTGEFRYSSPGAVAAGTDSDAWASDYALRAQQAIARAPQAYTYADPAGARRVELPYRVTTFRADDGRRTDLYVHYGVPIGDYDRAAAEIAVNAQTGAFLVGRDRSVLFERRQRLYGMRTDQIVRYEEANLWVETQAMTAPPGEAELSVEFQTTSGGVVAVQRRPVTLPDYSAPTGAGAHFAMSDLMLAFRAERVDDGRAVEPGDILRNGRSIRPAPWSVFRRDQRLVLYFELYDLAVGPEGRTDYEVELILAPKQRERGLLARLRRMGGRGDEVSVRFPGAGTARNQDFATNLDASTKPPGLYSLTLKVEDKAGRHTETRTVDVFLE